MSQLEFLEKWFQQHIEPQSPIDPSITWCVGAWSCFRQYVTEADRAGYQPFTMAEFGWCLTRMFPHAKGKTMKGAPVFTGVRFYSDEVGGKMVMGI